MTEVDNTDRSRNILIGLVSAQRGEVMGNNQILFKASVSSKSSASSKSSRLSGNPAMSVLLPTTTAPADTEKSADYYSVPL